MIKKYLVEHESGAGMVVEVDHSLMTDAELHDLNNFWSCARERLSDEDGDILHTVLKDLLNQVLRVQFEGDLNLQGVLNAFDYHGGGGQEGYPKLDGSAGIKLLKVDGIELFASDMTVKVEE